ncbi:MAG TPA: pyruvate dehydrogenase (acetyl-transferring), homodimeric type [Gammaproteobacteria bacterium]|nr:pyruvate dehydrogenase (acetyl-transferring), homodimeric type [Gammaproteobacteria bacterium]
MNKSLEALETGLPAESDIDPQETREWLEALDSLLEADGADRVRYLLQQLADEARRRGVDSPYNANTPYLNTIPAHLEPPVPGDPTLERKLRSYSRWNAMAMVVRANADDSGLGGHIASYASCATMLDVGFNHFFRGATDQHGGDMVFFQGHSSPGIYARAFLEGRLSEEQLINFRRDLNPDGSKGNGVTSYPHPWLMPEFWQFPTVSMGLGPIMAIYQARFMAYLHNRGLMDMQDRKVWAFLGDGEMDEPESRGALSLANREKLNNLVFVVNCNLQRLDGPVRGNGKIMQELEADFLGDGWNVIKVVWGGGWDDLLERDKSGLLAKRMEEVVDGEYQAYKSRGGAYTRQHFFGKYPELVQLVAHLSDEEIFRLKRGGHDFRKVYAAYHAAMLSDKPTVILCKTVKGYGMGAAGEGKNTTHQQKKLAADNLLYFRDRFGIPLSDEEATNAQFYKPADDEPEMVYLRECRKAMGGHIPARNPVAPTLPVPELSVFKAMLDGSGDREISTTMAFVRILTQLTKDKVLGKHIVPIVPDEARTFGMEGLFRQLGIYAFEGQKYEPEDAESFMFYREDKKGQILQEGINEAGAFSSWIAAGTAYSNHGVSMVPFYIFYSMFGFQRIGDLAWAAADMGARGFLLGATAGRTTLNGEGLQHQDGHSHLMAATIPNCRAYDPAYMYELAVIVQDGLRRMYGEDENIYYYLTVENENYAQPAMPAECEEGILRGIYKLSAAPKKKGKQLRAQLLGSGSILREVIAAAEILEQDFGVHCDVWSVTSFNELRRDGLQVERQNLLHPDNPPQACYIEKVLQDQPGPVVAATDYMKAYADQIRNWVKAPYVVLGTDGFGRSGTREELRRFFEVDRYHIVYNTLAALAREGELDASKMAGYAKQLGINCDLPDPVTV